MASKKIAKLELEKFKPSTDVIALSEQLEQVVGHNPITFAFKLANVISVVQQWVEHPEIAKLIHQLENSPAGFVTDKDPGVFYPPKVRAQCVTDALVNGLRLNGNEFNIISGKMMPVQAGWRRLCEEMGRDVPGGYSKEAEFQTQGLNCYDEGEPKIAGNIATIHMVIDATLKSNTTQETQSVKFERDISITIKSRDTVDTWIGKAERRMYRSFFRKYSGVANLPEADTAGEFDGSAPAQPPLGSQQKSTEKPKETKVVVQPPNGEPQERPTATRVPIDQDPKKPLKEAASDAEYTESSPEMNDAIDSMGAKPDAPPEPPGDPEKPQTELLPEEKPAAPANPPAGHGAPSSRPKTNF